MDETEQESEKVTPKSDSANKRKVFLRVGALALLADVAIQVPAREANTIQELHIAVGHILCDLIESAYTHDKSPVS